MQGTPLRTRKLTAGDKQRAARLKRNYVIQLALTCGRRISDAEGDALVADPGLSGEIALATYGVHMIRRAAGDSEGPALLALWREIAWTRTGAPVKGFKLDASRMLDAEQRIAARLMAQGGRV